MAAPVQFVVELKRGVDGHAVKPDLEALANDLAISVRDLTRIGLQYVTGMTSQSTYERVFGTKIDYRTRVVTNLNRGPRQVQEWVELGPAAIPQTLQDRIERIYLDRPLFLTD